MELTINTLTSINNHKPQIKGYMCFKKYSKWIQPMSNNMMLYWPFVANHFVWVTVMADFHAWLKLHQMTVLFFFFMTRQKTQYFLLLVVLLWHSQQDRGAHISYRHKKTSIRLLFNNLQLWHYSVNSTNS